MRLAIPGTPVDGKEAFDQGFPWLLSEASIYITEQLPRNASVFEWGCGGSTLWFATNHYRVISVETDPIWAERVGKRLAKEKLYHRVWLLHFNGSSTGLLEYAQLISHFPKNCFDLVLVDGRNRVECIRNAMPHVKPGGMLCLDNSERPRYAEGKRLLDQWDGIQWESPDWFTAVWTRPKG